MQQKRSDYQLLFSGIIAFFVVMTLDLELLRQLYWVEIVKLAAGLVSVGWLLYRIWQHYRQSEPVSTK